MAAWSLFFCVSNDALRSDDADRSMLNRIRRLIPHAKQYDSQPAVKIGRLAVSSRLQRSGIGTELMDFIKTWFSRDNKTGCRFIVVDALNNPDAQRFYQKNGFVHMTPGDAENGTRSMYYDLASWLRKHPELPAAG